MTKTEAVRGHFARNKDRYIVGGVCLAVGSVVTIVVFKQLRPVPVQHIAPSVSTTVGVAYKSPITTEVTNIIVAEMVERSNPSKIVQRLEDGTIWASQNAAARDLNIAPSILSKHLRGFKPEVNGEHFVTIPKAA